MYSQPDFRLAPTRRNGFFCVVFLPVETFAGVFAVTVCAPVIFFVRAGVRTVFLVFFLPVEAVVFLEVVLFAIVRLHDQVRIYRNFCATERCDHPAVDVS